MKKTATLTVLAAVISTLPTTKNTEDDKAPSLPHNPPVEVIEMKPMLIKGERVEIFNVEVIEMKPMQIKPSSLHYTENTNSEENFDDNGTANKNMLNQVHNIIWPSL